MDTQFNDNLNELLNNIEGRLRNEAQRLAMSGGVDTDASNPFNGPKACFYVALLNMVDQVALTSEAKKIAKHLRYF